MTEIRQHIRVAEICHLDFSEAANQDYLRLEIAMDHAPRVSEGNSVRNIRPNCQILFQCRAIDELGPRPSPFASRMEQNSSFDWDRHTS